MAKKPTLKSGPASKYEAPNEIIREFGANNGTGDGGLLSLRVLEDGTLVLDIYQLSGNVRINLPQAVLEQQRVQQTRSMSENWVQDNTLFWVDEDLNLYTAPGDGLSPTLIGPGGDVGGDIQASEAYSVSFKHTSQVGHRVDVNFYAATEDEDDAPFFVQRQILSGVFDDDHNELSSGPSSYTNFGQFDTLPEARKAAYEAASAFKADEIWSVQPM